MTRDRLVGQNLPRGLRNKSCDLAKKREIDLHPYILLFTCPEQLIPEDL